MNNTLSFFRGGDADVSVTEVAAALRIGQVDRDTLDNMHRLMGANEGAIEVWKGVPDAELLSFIAAHHHGRKSFSNAFKIACEDELHDRVWHLQHPGENYD